MTRFLRATPGGVTLFISALVACLLVASLSGCRTTTSGGEPGSVHLNLLADEQVFQSLPPGSHAAGPPVRAPAWYAQPGFSGGGWHGPAVTLTFTNSDSPASVFSYYEARVASFGWTATGNRNVMGYPQVWTKPYPGGSKAYLTLLDLDLQTSGSGRSRYVLNASA
jgi:hypothetical protein